MAQASEFELAHVVLAYLETKGWHKTATSFQREAKTLLKSGRRPQGQAVRVLDDLVNGYLQLAAREAQRATLAQLNPLAGQMLSLLDISAALPPLSMPHLQQQQQPAELMRGSGGAAAAAVAAAAAAAGGAMVPMAAVGGGGQPLLDPLQPAQQPAQQPRPATTPGRHAQRKGAPQRKRRRLDAEFEAARPLMPTSPPDFPYNEHSLLGDVPFGDLLYRAVDPAGVMQVLDHEDEALNKFSTLLADNINRTALGGDHFPDAPDMLFTDLLQDPEAQEIVRRLVGTANEGDGGGPSAPPQMPLPSEERAEGRPRRGFAGRENKAVANRGGDRPSSRAAPAAEGDGGAPQEQVDMQFYKDNPDELEDLLDEIVG